MFYEIGKTKWREMMDRTNWGLRYWDGDLKCGDHDIEHDFVVKEPNVAGHNTAVLSGT